MVMSCLLRDAKGQLQAHPDLKWYGGQQLCEDFTTANDLPSSGCFDISFVDDCAFGIHGKSNQQVEAGIQAVVEAMTVASKRRGLIINFEQGKTEVLWHIVGKGSKSKKMSIAADESQLKWHTDQGHFALRVSHAYKHLGTWIQAGNVHGKEIQQRSALARSTWGTLARAFYNKPYVSLQTKSKVFQSTALSQFMYNAHVWTGVAPKEWDKWHNALRKPYGLMVKSKLRGVNPLHLDTDAVSALAGILPPKHALQVARLRYLKRITVACPQVLWDLIMADAYTDLSWISACQEAFRWFRMHYDVAFAPVSDDIQVWLPIIALDTSWKGRVRRAAFSCLQYCTAIAEKQVSLDRFCRVFQSNGGVLPVDSQQVQSKWQCDLCQRCFPSKRGLASHAARAHGYKRIERYYALHATCDACGKYYHARARLLMHLYDCPACLLTLQHCFPPAPEDEVERLDNEGKQYAGDMRTQGWWKTKAFLPPFKIHGPLLPPPNTPDALAFKLKWEARTQAPGAAFQELQGRCAPAEPPEKPQVHLFEEDMPAFVMHAPHGPNVGDGVFANAGLAREAARLHIKWLVFVHYFSGYRRSQDLHQVIEDTPLEGGTHIMTISVDMCMQKKDGNLATSNATSCWLERIRAGQIIGAGGGPPCETFTAARFLPDGPRPLRTGSHPDGLPALNAREWMQVRIGSRLVYFIFEILLELARFGGCGFAEHPQWPLWAVRHDPASIWSSRFARLCKTLNCFSVTSFDQCVVGSPAKKPTTILLLRLDSFRHELLTTGNGGRCHHHKGAHEQLQGRDATGVFRTAVGKVYPAGLNQALGRAVRRFVENTFDHKLLRQELPIELTCFKQQVFEDDGVVQPDYHGLVT